MDDRWTKGGRKVDERKKRFFKKNVEKLKEQLAYESAPEHHDSLQSKVEDDLEHRAATEEAEKNIVDLDKSAEFKRN